MDYNTSLDSSPRKQVDLWYRRGIARELGVERSARRDKSQRLHLPDVGVVAEDARKADLAYLVKLFWSEPLRSTELVEKPVSPFEPGELIADDAQESRSDDGVLYRELGKAANVQVNVVWAGVNRLQSSHTFFGNVPGEVEEACSSSKTAQLPDVIVRRQAVVTTPLGVQRHEVKTERSVSVEELVRDVFREETVGGLSSLCSQTS